MEFRFNVEPYFKKNVVRVGNSLVPSDFQADRRTLLETTSRFSEIINDMGEASARAQGLSRAVTTAQKLRNSDHTVYLMYEKGGKNGLVTGLLKVGRKRLYVFDEEGETHTLDAPCVLDFYVHESRQRFGRGKELFELMLDSEKYKANQLAIDRPSDKLLAFLRKHYGLARQIRQMNNFVIYDGFFDLNEDQNNNAMNGHGARLSNLHITNSPKNAMLMSPSGYDSSSPNVQMTPIGRYAAPRPMGHMAEIIHNDSMNASREPDRYRRGSFYPALHHYQSQPALYTEPLDPTDHHHHPMGDVVDDGAPPPPPPEMSPALVASAELPLSEPMQEGHEHESESAPAVEVTESDDSVPRNTRRRPSPPSFLKSLGEELQLEEPIKQLQSPNQSFHYSKQHTGLKNLSFNVGAAVMPTGKMQFDQEQPESFGMVKINRPTKASLYTWEPHKIMGRKKELRLDVPNPEKLMMASKSAENLTDQGYLDLKFYHNKLW